MTWTGPEIPLDLQAMVVVKHYRAALDMLLRQMAHLHKETMEKVGNPDATGLINALNEDDFFNFCMLGLVEGHEKFGDALFRMEPGEISVNAQEEIRDAVIYLCVLLWVHQGAEFPEGTFDEDDDGEEE